MNSYVSEKIRTKIDWFIDGNLKQTFNSYIHAAEFFKKEFSNNRISESIIRNLITGRTKTSAVFGKNNVPDLCLHVFEETSNLFICLCCEESKILNEQNFHYKNKEQKIFNNKCKECCYS